VNSQPLASGPIGLDATSRVPKAGADPAQRQRRRLPV